MTAPDVLKSVASTSGGTDPASAVGVLLEYARDGSRCRDDMSLVSSEAVAVETSHIAIRMMAYVHIRTLVSRRFLQGDGNLAAILYHK